MRRQRPGPFALDLRDIVQRPGEMREFTIDLDAPEKWGEGLVAVAQGEPIELDVRAESVHEGILMSGSVATEYAGECGRCLTDIRESLKVEFQELFAYPDKEATDFEVQDDHVDLETLVREAIVLSLPFQPVCQPDCPGLDMTTGVRLAESPGAEQGESIDHRWSALQNYTPDHDDENPRLGTLVAENREMS